MQLTANERAAQALLEDLREVLRGSSVPTQLKIDVTGIILTEICQDKAQLLTQACALLLAADCPMEKIDGLLELA
jgi:hypothetical protein